MAVSCSCYLFDLKASLVAVVVVEGVLVVAMMVTWCLDSDYSGSVVVEVHCHQLVEGKS